MDAVEAPWPTRVEWLKDLIVERPLAAVPLPAPCPWCGSVEVTEKGHEQTLLGGAIGGPDTNHHWRHYLCDKCHREYCYQIKDGWGWYTENDRYENIKGVAGCFESVNYTCAHCGGRVVRDDDRVPRVFRTPPLRPCRDPYKCLGCGAHTEADDGGCDEGARARPMSVDWKTYEELGVARVNPDAIKKLQLGGYEEETR